ncbi:MAG: alcohol dehydrogenase catalytic domain-containing protein [Deltaproteobacteria bacterium]|nr:alcohol dehydrogenase catalytic domain-containing protein [Deltaproteobacteria bacterium]
MKVAVYTGPREPFRIEERPTPTPGPDEVLVRIGRCGICATDVSTWTGDAGMETNKVYGHEFAGEVVARGDRVRGMPIGALVTAQCVTACGRCEECARGHLCFCPEWKQHPTGGFGQYMTLPEREAYVLPPPLTLEDGALVEPLAVGLRGVKLADVGAGDRVLVLGAGPIGLCAAYWAKRRGAAQVVVVAPSDRRRSFALAMGADAFVLNASGPSDVANATEARIRDALGGPPDLVFECAGFPGAVMQAMNAIRAKGTIVCMGYGLHPETIQTGVPLFKELCVRFSMTYDRSDYQEVIATLAAGHLEPRCMITKTIPLEALTATIEGLVARAPECKVMVDPWA